MSRRKKILVYTSVGLLLSLFILVLARNLIIRSAVVAGSRRVIGADCSLEGISVGLFGTDLGVDHLKVMQPPGGFGAGTMIDLPELYVDYELFETMGGKTHLTELRLNLAEVVVVKGKDGKINLETLIPPSKEEKEQPAAEFQIDRALISIGRVIYRDLAETPVKDRVYNVGLKNEEVRDIRSADDLRGLVLKVLLRNLANLELVGREIRHLIPNVLSSFGKSLFHAGEKATDVPGKLKDDLKKIKLPF